MMTTLSAFVRLQCLGWSGVLLRRLNQLRLNSALCDLAIITSNGNMLMAHACVLASAGSYIQAFLMSNHRPFPAVRLPISDDIWNNVLRFIYTGETSLPPEWMSDLHSAASLLGIDTLTQAIESAGLEMGAKNTAVTTTPPVEMRVKNEDSEPTEPTPLRLTQTDMMHLVESTPFKTMSFDHMSKGNELRLSSDTTAKEEALIDRIIKSETLDEAVVVLPLGMSGADEDIPPAGPSVQGDYGEVMSEDMNQSVVNSLVESEDPQVDDVQLFTAVMDSSQSDQAAGLREDTDRGVDQRSHLLTQACEHTVVRQYRCGSCGNEFARKASLVAHKERVHGYQCASCGVIRQRITGGKPCNICTSCGKKSRRVLAKHATGTEKTPHQCYSCDKAFAKKSQFVLHMRTHTGKKPYQCRSCDKAFAMNRQLMLHMHVHTGEKPYQCSFCDKKFSWQGGLMSHERTHTGEKPYQCSFCDKAFCRKDERVSHERTHTGEKPYQCSFCDKAFSNRNVHIKHERTHTGEKPYQCSWCGMAFIQGGSLVSHERTHTGEKPYQCSSCGKKFVTKKGLRSHTRTHTGEKPYQCGSCDKAFASSGGLVSHVRLHTGEKPFQCNSCGKTFRNRDVLVRHIRVHTGKKPYQCSWCDRAFSQMITLVRHARTHTGEMPFQCSSCGKAFTTNGQLGRHSRIHTQRDERHQWNTDSSM